MMYLKLKAYRGLRRINSNFLFHFERYLREDDPEWTEDNFESLEERERETRKLMGKI